MLSKLLNEPEPVNGPPSGVVKDMHLPERQEDFAVERRRDIVYRLRNTVSYCDAFPLRKERRMEKSDSSR